MTLTLAGLFFNDNSRSCLRRGSRQHQVEVKTIGHSLSFHLRVTAEIPRPANIFR
jgi:hypothetical protein